MHCGERVAVVWRGRGHFLFILSPLIFSSILPKFYPLLHPPHNYHCFQALSLLNMSEKVHVPECVAALVVSHLCNGGISREDWKTLLNSSMVCRGFRGPCQHVLFHSMWVRDYLGSGGTQETFGRTQDPSGMTQDSSGGTQDSSTTRDVKKRTFETFLTFLSESPRVRGCVRRLSFVGVVDSTSTGTTTVTATDTTSTWTATVPDGIPLKPLLNPILLSSILSLLPNLRRLCLCNVQLSTQPSHLLSVFSHIIPCTRFDLEELSLFHVGSGQDDIGDLCATLSLFGELRLMMMHNCTFSTAPPTTTHKRNSPGKVTFPSNLSAKYLVYNSYTTGLSAVTFFDFIGRTRTCSELKIFAPYCCTRQEVLALGPLIKKCAKSLVQVMLRVRDGFKLEYGEFIRFFFLWVYLILFYFLPRLFYGVGNTGVVVVVNQKRRL